MGSSNRYGLPLTSAVLEVADQLLLLRVDGDHRDAALDASFRLGINVLELSVAIRMLRALDCLVGRLQTVAVLTQQLGYRLVADPNTATLKEFYRQRVRPLASPAKGRLWVTTCDRIDQLLEIWPNFGVRLLEWPFSCAAPNVYDVLALCAGANFVSALAHCTNRKRGPARDLGNAAATDCIRFSNSPKPPATLVQGRLQRTPLLANDALVVQRT